MSFPRHQRSAGAGPTPSAEADLAGRFEDSNKLPCAGRSVPQDRSIRPSMKAAQEKEPQCRSSDRSFRRLLELRWVFDRLVPRMVIVLSFLRKAVGRSSRLAKIATSLNGAHTTWLLTPKPFQARASLANCAIVFLGRRLA